MADEKDHTDRTDRTEETIERPATWENVVAGRAMEAIGHLTGTKEMVEEGEEQDEVAHEVREEYREQQDDD